LKNQPIPLNAIMGKNIHSQLITSVILIIIIFAFGCDKQKSSFKETGLLKGVITIGPLCPVQSLPPNPSCLPTADTYKSYPVSIWTSDGKNRVAQLSPELDGSYSTELPAGIYRIILGNVQNRIGGSNLPVTVEIMSNNCIILDISIDTGIR
jgi:hypothetical protein